MRMHPLAPIVLLLPALAIGCVSDVDDELDFEAVGDRAAYPPLPDEDTTLAYGMLRVANELDFDALDIDVALDRRSATSIVEFRAGADELLGTADDQYISSLAELDALYWLGPANLWRIQNYAILEGYEPGSLPAASCDPALDDAIEQCLHFVEDAATPVVPGGYTFGWEPFAADLRPSCLGDSNPSYPSTAYFSDGGAVGYIDSLLGHHALLCDAAPEPVCELGVAGIGSLIAPECDAQFDVTPLLTPYAADPADEADWAAAVAALNAAPGDVDYYLRVFEYAPGMTPTLLGDTMQQVLSSSSVGYLGPWLERETSDVIPPMSAGAQALLNDVIADLGLGSSPFQVGTAAEEVPCPNCHIFYDGFVLMFRNERIVVALDRDTFWDS